MSERTKIVCAILIWNRFEKHVHSIDDFQLIYVLKYLPFLALLKGIKLITIISLSLNKTKDWL